MEAMSTYTERVECVKEDAYSFISHLLWNALDEAEDYLLRYGLTHEDIRRLINRRIDEIWLAKESG